jgi:hypothetical protein
MSSFVNYCHFVQHASFDPVKKKSGLRQREDRTAWVIGKKNCINRSIAVYIPSFNNIRLAETGDLSPVSSIPVWQKLGTCPRFHQYQTGRNWGLVPGFINTRLAETGDTHRVFSYLRPSTLDVRP